MGFWNPSLKGSNLTLSAGDTVATKSGTGWESLAGLTALSGTGSFDILCGGGTLYYNVGVCNASLTVGLPGGSNNNSLVVNYFGEIVHGGAVIATASFGFTSGDRITVFYDTFGAQVRFAKNGGTPTSWYNISGISGAIYPAGSIYDAPGSLSETSQSLFAPLLTNASSFYAPTVTRGAVTLAPGLTTNASIFYVPTVSRGSVTLTPALATNASAFYTPTVVQGQSLSPSRLDNTAVFYRPTVQYAAQTLLPALFANANEIYTAAVLRGAQTATPGARVATVAAEKRRVAVPGEARMVSAANENRTVVAPSGGRFAQAA